MEPGILIFCLLLSGFFAGTETVFLSANRIRLAGFIRRRRWGAKLALWFLESPQRFVITTLVGTNLANIAFSSLFTAYFARHLSPTWILIGSTGLVLLFAEIIPKSLGRDLADRLIIRVAPPLRFLQILLFPVMLLTRWTTSLLLAMLGVAKGEVREFFSRRDLELLIREGVRTGSLQEEHESWISRVLKLPILSAREIMTPRTEMVALEYTDKVEELRRVVLSSGYSKIPLYDKDLDHIIGAAYAQDLLDNPPALAAILKPISFISEQKRAVEVFRDLRRAHQSMAIVVDEWGGTAGLVTLEDVIEEITGDIEDEYDRGQHRIRELAGGRWVVPGRIEVEDLNRRLKLEIPEGDYETLGGYLMAHLEHIPATGEMVEIGPIQYKIARASQNRVITVVIKNRNPQE